MVSAPDVGYTAFSALYGTSPQLDELSLKFVVWSRTATGPSLDIGCGDGCATVAALGRGAHVVAVDTDPARLEQLLARVPVPQRVRVKVRLGELPSVDFKIARFAGVHVARVLHLLDDSQIRQSLRKFFRWLYPDGKLFLSVLTPGGSCWESLREHAAEQGRGSGRWTVHVDDAGGPLLRMYRAASAIRLLDEHALQTELEAAGFIVEEQSSYQLPWDPSQVCCGTIARCGH